MTEIPPPPGDRQRDEHKSPRDRLIEALNEEHNPSYWGDEPRDAEKLVDAFAHELVDRARRGVDVLEEHVGGFQYARDIRELLDVADPTTLDLPGWKF